MSRRQEIVDIIKSRLQNISVTNGYANDIAKVDEWAMYRLEDKDLPALIVRDTRSSANNIVSGSTTYTLTIEIDLLVSDKETTMERLRTLMGDVLHAIGHDSDDFYEYRVFNGDEIMVEHSGNLYGGVRMNFSVEYATPDWEM